MFVNAVLLAALAVEAEEAADGHPRLVVLVEEAAGVAFHTQAPQPMTTHRLPEAPPARPIIARPSLPSSSASSSRYCRVAHGDNVGVVSVVVVVVGGVDCC